MATAQKLNESKKAKYDEFYTLYEDIAAELPLYKEQFRGKRIICPCDWDESFEEALVYKEEGYVAPLDLFSVGGTIKRIDIEKSKDKVERDISTVKCNFIKFLVAHAEAYEIKSISVSGYNPKTGEGVKFQDIDYSNYDIVITNPPYSAFDEFIATMYRAGIKFLAIGPTSALTHRDIFYLFKDNKLWGGYHLHMTGFLKPNGELLPKNDANVRYSCWYTNLDVKKKHEKKILTYKYTPEEYPKFANFNAINVGEVKKIPYDYDGLMGVPVTILFDYHPDQFEIIERSAVLAERIIVNGKSKNDRFYIENNGKLDRKFDRVVIRNKEVYHDEN